VDLGKLSSLAHTSHHGSLQHFEQILLALGRLGYRQHDIICDRERSVENLFKFTDAMFFSKEQAQLSNMTFTHP